MLLTADRDNKASIYHCQLSPPLPILRGEQVGAHQISVPQQPGAPAHVYFHDGDEYSEVAKHYVCAQLRQTYEDDVCCVRAGAAHAAVSCIQQRRYRVISRSDALTHRP